MDVELAENEQLHCSMCDKKFNVHTKYIKHLETHNLTCDKCNINFKTYHRKRLHDRSTHPQKKDKTCRICPEESFKTEKEYLLHVRDIHKGKLIDCYMCNVCGKTFKTRSELRQHINSKCGTEKLFTCKVCGKKLMSPGSLYNHMRRHNDEANFMCRFCAKLFHTAGQVKVHERIHTQQKDFVCDVCGKGFCHRQSLITHSTVHTGIKPYQCEGCGKSFSCVGNLLKHRKSHADTCGLLLLTSHTVQDPSTKIKVKINTPASSKLKKVQKNKELQDKLSKLDSILKDTDKPADSNIDEVVVKAEEITCANKNGTIIQNTDVIFELCHKSKIPKMEEQCCESSEGNIGDAKIEENHEVSEQCNSLEVVKEENGFFESSDESDSESRIESDLDLVRFEKVDVEESASLPENVKETHNELTLKKRSKRKKDEKLNDFIKERKLVNGKAASCKYCEKEYTTIRWLYRHELEHEENDIPESNKVKKLPFKCNCCKKCFETKDEVKTHQQLAHSDILSCRECGDKIFASVDSLRAHKHIFHKGVLKKEYIYICEKCGKKFRQKTMLQVHNETNCGSGPFIQCKVCQKEFSSIHTRNTHMRIHTSEKNLICKFCGKSFHWKGQLKVHERSHTGEKPYTCLFCPSAFAYRDSLITHSTIHTGIKPYFCKGCGWRFSCVGNLAKHKVTYSKTCGAWYQKQEKGEPE